MGVPWEIVAIEGEGQKAKGWFFLYIIPPQNFIVKKGLLLSLFLCF